MRSSFREDDVTILLTDITGKVEPLGNLEREHNIQNGMHYSEMLPKEKAPSAEYELTYNQALSRYAERTAQAVAVACGKIWREKRENVVLVSLARAGTPIGVLMKRYIKMRYQIDVPHYTISIIRGKGIDHNAMRYILQRHMPEFIQFVDGWTGKGAIQRELNQAMVQYPGVDPELAVLSDPANLVRKCGTHEDFLIASSCLNSTVSGLISRTFFRSDIISDIQFHGAMYYAEFEEQDVTYEFIDTVERYFDVISDIDPEYDELQRCGLDEVYEIAKCFSIDDINLIKPGIGETTRVLMRRIPWKILVYSLNDKEHLGHIYQLAKEKEVPVEVYPLQNYRACGLIQILADN